MEVSGNEINKVSFLKGALGRCPVCGQGKLYSSFLKVAPSCSHCGQALSAANPGDGPVVLVIMLAGLVACGGLFVSFINWNWSPVALLIVWPTVAVIVSLILMPVLKGMMIASQIRHRVRDR